MRILSKYKDYYDYLTGIYGVDNKIILDRRNACDMKDLLGRLKSEITYKLGGSPYTELYLHIAGRIYAGVYDVKTKAFIWRKDLLSLGEHKTYSQYERTWRSIRKSRKYYPLDPSNPNGYVKIKYDWICMDPFTENGNHISNAAIFLDIQDRDNGDYDYPNLSQLGFANYLSAEDIYLKLSDYLSPKDLVITPLTDKEKIISKGFDSKVSFRKRKTHEV